MRKTLVLHVELDGVADDVDSPLDWWRDYFRDVVEVHAVAKPSWFSAGDESVFYGKVIHATQREKP